MAARIRTRVIEGLHNSEASSAVAAATTLSVAIVPLRVAGNIAPETILVAANELAQRAFAGGKDRIVVTEALRFDVAEGDE